MNDIDRLMWRHPGRSLDALLEDDEPECRALARLRRADPVRFEWLLVSSATAGAPNAVDEQLRRASQGPQEGPPSAPGASPQRVDGTNAVRVLVDLPRGPHALLSRNAFDALDTASNSRLHLSENSRLTDSQKPPTNDSGETDE